MRHLKSDVETVKNNVECGLQLADKTIEVQRGDKVICYTYKKVREIIDWNPGF